MKKINVAIVGAGPGCLAIMGMISRDQLQQIQINLAGIADIDPEAPALKQAQSLGIFTTNDYHDLFPLTGLDLIIELTGDVGVAQDIQLGKPTHVRFLDHRMALIFWDFMRLEEEKLKAEREAEERISRERDYTARILNNLSDAVVVMDKNFKIESVNATFLREFGISPEMLIGRPCFDAMFDRSKPCLHPPCPLKGYAGEKKKARRREYGYLKDGDMVYYEADYRPLIDNGGRAARWLVSIRNITGRKMLELNLEKSQKKYKDLFDNAREGLILFDEKGRILETNLSVARMLGYSKNELERMKISELPEKKSREILAEHHLEDLKGRGREELQIHFVKKGGALLPVETTVTWLPDENLFRIMVRDITVQTKLDENRKAYSDRLEREVEERTRELKASEAETRRQKRTAEGIIYGSPTPMFVVDKDHKIAYWNKACEKLTGFSSDEMIGTDRHWEPFYERRRPLLADVIIDNDPETMKKAIKNMGLSKSPILEGGYETEYFISRLGEKGTHLYINAAPIKDDSGNIEAAIVTYQDFSERVQMTQELQASEAETRRQKSTAEGIIYGSPIPMFVLGKEHRIINWNKECEKLTGFSSDEMIGTDRQWEPFYPHKRPILADLILDNDLEEIKRLYRSMNLRKSPIVEGAYEAEYFFPQLGKAGVHLYFNAAPIRDDSGEVQGVINTYQDFSERVKMTQVIKRREAFVQNLIQNSIDGIIATDSTGKAKIFNQAAVDILGYSAKEIIGLGGFREIVSEEAASLLREALYSDQYGAPGKIGHMEVNFMNREGETIPVRVSGALLYEMDKELGSVIFFQDLREIRRLEKEKGQAQRMAAIGKTVAGVAHYIKNVLSGLQGGAYVINSAMTKRDLELVERGWAMVEKNIDQIGNIVTDMLIYSTGRSPTYKMVDPNELVLEVLELMAERTRISGVSMVRSLQPGLKKVGMDRTGIHRCLLDLISNAIDACTLEGIIEGKGVVKVETDSPPGWGVRFQVSDNGTGMDKKTQDKLFTDFFTTKGYKGTGLGLPVTHKIIEEHEGVLTFESEAGRGTTFALMLPKREVE